MKTISTSVAVFYIVCGAICAGPPQDIHSEAAPAATSSTWTGFYLGAFGGYTRAQIDPRLSLSGGFDQIPAPITNGLESRGSEAFDYDGGELGGLIGFNYQVGQIVIGLESAGGYLWSRDSRDTGALIFGQGVPPLEIRSSFKTHYLITVAPRIGYAFGRVLPYVTGGLAVGDLEWSQELHDLADPMTHLGRHISKTNAGWMVGGGVEYAVTDHWRARLQYQYVDLGRAEFDSQVTTSPTFLSHHSVGLTEHNATFALIYKF
jgi:outer membrane immunogenic protein